MKSNGKFNLGVITFPIDGEGVTPLADLLDLLCPLSGATNLITGGQGYLAFKNDKRIDIHEIIHEVHRNQFMRVLAYITTQIKICQKMLTLKDTNLWVFFIGGDTLLLPMLTAWLLRRKKLLIFPGSSQEILGTYHDNLQVPAKILSRINCGIADKIILYSPNLIKEWEMGKYEDKITIAPQNFIDFDKFKYKKNFDERDNLVGYIGRLSKEKGFMNFLLSIKETIKEKKDLKFIIVGDGESREEMNQFIKKNGLSNVIQFEGWVENNKLPDYLNDLKLIVIPSYTEGLPNVMLESMACGTPVLANSVGSIPDVITDELNGFLMERNIPEVISMNILRSLDHHDLAKVSENALRLVEEEYNYENVFKKYKQILKSFK
jgi:glycosyltransferase involved in cell wall biosynthesis